MTRKMILIAGVAGMAIAAPASAERGGHKDRGQQAQSNRGAERPQRAERAQRAERPQMRQRAQRAERPKMQRMERQRPQRAERVRMERPQRQRIERADRQRFERQNVKRADRRHVERQRVEQADRRRVERQRVQHADRIRIERPQRVERMERIQHARRADRDDRIRMSKMERRTFERRAERFNTPNGLPHLLNRHDMRPLKARHDVRVKVGERLAANAFSAIPAYYGSRFADTPNYYYRYDDDYGYVYRVNRDNNLVSALMPLFGGYSIGDPWPATYRSSYVPYAYQPYYYDTSNAYYRYDGNAIYRIDPTTQLISGIVALLTGNQFGVGQILPASYGAYNVPLAYRSSYYDTNDAWYRYGDGYIYQIDPYSRRIEDRYPIYGAYGDYAVGQPWPVAYPDYNVPYAYRDMYYDTPQYQYRYANGGIYQVDPTTQLITALVSLVSGQPLSVGSTLPASYGAYNVPFAYRDRYYDTNDAWYRYGDGYVYQIDPRTRLIQDMTPIYI